MRATTALALSAFLGSSFAATADDWKSRSIYQIMTDRFALGNGTFPPCNTTEKRYCGGDWGGIVDNLDYIQDMGFDAVWISPVSESVNVTEDGEAYHGYWTGDLDALNKHFGNEGDLKNLVSSLHAREMFLMLDVNVNHMGSNSTPANVSWLLPFNNASTEYHYQCKIEDWSNQWEVENCWLTGGGGGGGGGKVLLPDLNTENQTVVDRLNGWVNQTVRRFNVDGVRVAAARHVRKDFWPAFAANASVFTIGEVDSDDTAYTAGYTADALDSAFDHASFSALQKTFSTPNADFGGLVGALRATQEKYKRGAFASGVYVENHETARFASLTSDRSLVKNAMAWTFATDAMPVVLYGQEHGFAGAQEGNANHAALWMEGMRKESEGVELIKALNAARRMAATANKKFHETPVKVLLPGDGGDGEGQAKNGTLALLKPPMLSLLTNSGNASTPEWTVLGSESGFEPGLTLVDVLSCNVVVTDEDGSMTVRSEGGAPVVLVPQSALLAAQGGNARVCRADPPPGRVDTTSTSGGAPPINGRAKDVSWAGVAASLAVVAFFSTVV